MLTADHGVTNMTACTGGDRCEALYKCEVVPGLSGQLEVLGLYVY